MAELPYTILSCCVSLDGFLDDATQRRLVLSNEADLDRVDALRAECDAILVGAGTVRADDPRLRVRDARRRAERRCRGLPEDPVKVTLTDGAKLDRDAHFFTCGGARVVYCPSGAVADARAVFGDRATVVDGGPVVAVRSVAEDLHRRGVRRLLVEGGASVLTQFLDQAAADELQLAVAPLMVGDPQAPRLLGPGGVGRAAGERARLAGVRQVGDVAVLRYALSERFAEFEESGEG